MRKSQPTKLKMSVILLQERLPLAAQVIGVLLIPLIILVALAGLGIWRLNIQDNDLKEARLQLGTATVTGKSLIYTKTGMDARWQFRINGRIANTSLLRSLDDYQDERLIWTKVGDTVPVTYRVGKSGTIYVENWQAPPHKIPLPR